MADFYHIYISPGPGISIETVEVKMNLALDWFRYDDKNWVVYTTSDAKKWYARLESLAKPGGHVFIVKIDFSSYYGFMTKELWKWVQAKLDSK